MSTFCAEHQQEMATAVICDTNTSGVVIINMLDNELLIMVLGTSFMLQQNVDTRVQK